MEDAPCFLQLFCWTAPHLLKCSDSLWLHISRQRCQEYGVIKDRQMWQGTSSYPTHCLHFFYTQWSSLLSPSHILLSCTRSFHLVSLCVLSRLHTCIDTYPAERVMQKQDTSSFFLSRGCRTIAILHQPFRNLLLFLFQWCRPEALALQLCLTVYIIKCSICRHISWAVSDKCYQSSYFSE